VPPFFARWSPFYGSVSDGCGCGSSCGCGCGCGSSCDYTYRYGYFGAPGFSASIWQEIYNGAVYNSGGSASPSGKYGWMPNFHVASGSSGIGSPLGQQTHDLKGLGPEPSFNNLAGESPWLPALPEIAQESLIVAQESSTGWTVIDTIQFGLDIAGFIPVIGIPADLANAGIHLVRGNYADAGLSAIGAIPGFGDAIKGGAKIAKAAGGVAGAVGQGAKQGSNAVKAGGEVAGGAQKTLNKNIGDCKLAPNDSGGACFTEGTQIVVGVEYDKNDVFVQYITVNIENIKVGDYVYSYDTLTGEVSQKEVTAVFVRETNAINYLTIADENGNTQVLETTDSHPFWVVTDEPGLERAARSVVDENGAILYHHNIAPGLNGFWVEAKDLREGDVFLGANGELSTLVATERVVFPDGIKVYNFTVAGNHNYFVIAKCDEFGQTCVLVHNMCEAPKIIQSKGHVIKKSTANKIVKENGLDPKKVNKGTLGKALEQLKKVNGYPSNYHGKICINGDYLDKAGKYIDNILDYLQIKK